MSSVYGAGGVLAVEPEVIANAVNRVLAWSRARRYLGWSKHDALNSPVLRTVFGWARWPRIIAIQLVSRAPFNVRPLLGVRQAPNPKGLALFALGLLDLYRLSRAEESLREARALMERLVDLRSPTASGGNAWGYHYPWQDLGFYAPPGTPNAVVTAFVCEAFLEAYRTTSNTRYLEIVEGAVPFFLRDLAVLKDEPEQLCLAYMPFPMRMRVMDVSALIAAVLAQWAQVAGEGGYLATASRLARYVGERQTSEGAWFYTDPPGDSPVRHDNYHTGFILDALHRYMRASEDRSLESTYRRGLEFYARHHFTAEGAPRWMSDQEYPHDIHGAAQGILTFSRHLIDHPGFANRIVKWSLDNMYDPEGRFYYQQRRFYTNRFTEMRWCNGWMVRALAAHLRALGGADEAN